MQNAEAELYEKQKESEAIIAKAEAEKNAEVCKADGIKAIALAEAEGIKAKGLAEAEGIKKRTEAMQEMSEAGILEMYFEKLPEITKELASPLANIDSITMYGNDNTARMTQDITKSLNEIVSGVNDSLGFDLKSMLGGFLGGGLASTLSQKDCDANSANLEIENIIVEDNEKCLLEDMEELDEY